MSVVMWTAVLLLLYCYVLYPGILILLARLFPRPVRKGPCTPSVTMLIPAHDEEEMIGRKIENTLALDYPRASLQVLVISDGSTD
ncbi:MAG: glycosyltransferase family 2 protein, partial [Candidatus Aureabacteria bacterium]|nr:glycosyltransferase family 2 protein [Candidatus Auribacterota bacterium]